MDNQQPITEDEFIARFYRPGMPAIAREKALIRRWAFLSGMRQQIFELLMQQDRWMGVKAMMEALDKKNTQSIIQPLVQLKAVGMVEKKREGARVFYRLRLGLAQLYVERVIPAPPRPMHARIFQALTEHGELYQAQLIRQLGATWFAMKPGIAKLEAIGVIEVKPRQTSYGRLFYRLAPGAAERYQRWLAEQVDQTSI